MQIVGILLPVAIVCVTQHSGWLHAVPTTCYSQPFSVLDLCSLSEVWRTLAYFNLFKSNTRTRVH